MERKINKFIYWAPRILGLLFIAFLALFSLDIFDLKLDFWQTILGLFMHNIPALILLAVLLISWKYELIGAIVFTLAGILYIVITMINIPNWRLVLSWSLTIAGPAILIGILFFIGWLKKRKTT